MTCPICGGDHSAVSPYLVMLEPWRPCMEALAARVKALEGTANPKEDAPLRCATFDAAEIPDRKAAEESRGRHWSGDLSAKAHRERKAKEDAPRCEEPHHGGQRYIDQIRRERDMELDRLLKDPPGALAAIPKRIAERLTGWTPRDLRSVDNPSLSDPAREGERTEIAEPPACLAKPSPEGAATGGRCAACGGDGMQAHPGCSGCLACDGPCQKCDGTGRSPSPTGGAK